MNPIQFAARDEVVEVGDRDEVVEVARTAEVPCRGPRRTQALCVFHERRGAVSKPWISKAEQSRIKQGASFFFEMCLRLSWLFGRVSLPFLCFCFAGAGTPKHPATSALNLFEPMYVMYVTFCMSAMWTILTRVQLVEWSIWAMRQLHNPQGQLLANHKRFCTGWQERNKNHPAPTQIRHAEQVRKLEPPRQSPPILNLPIEIPPQAQMQMAQMQAMAAFTAKAEDGRLQMWSKKCLAVLGQGKPLNQFNQY